jgi:hypothetical protein
VLYAYHQGNCTHIKRRTGTSVGTGVGEKILTNAVYNDGEPAMISGASEATRTLRDTQVLRTLETALTVVARETNLTGSMI